MALSTEQPIEVHCTNCDWQGTYLSDLPCPRCLCNGLEKRKPFYSCAGLPGAFTDRRRKGIMVGDKDGWT
jgi:hypothetical protein